MSVDIIYNMGDDALQNLFDISIGPMAYLNNLMSTLFRVQGFTIPGTGVSMYDVNYKTQKITKPGGKIEAPNEFSIDFRVDRYWYVYKGLVAWKNAVANSYTGVIGPDNRLSHNRVPITVWPVESTAIPIPNFTQWTFVGCMCTAIGDIGFDYTAGDPLTITATFNFLAMDDSNLGTTG